jgi:UbiD family decarboxylase
MREFVQQLMSRGDVSIVDRPVDPRFELAAVTRASQRVSEKAIFFERVQGSGMRVVSNLYGSHARLCELIGSPDRTFCKRWWEVMDAPLTFPAGELVPFGDRITGKLSDLPQIWYHGLDAGPYVTSPIFLAKEPDTGVPNLSFHRSMHVSDSELRIRLGSRHDLTRYQAKAESRGQALEAALLIGTSPYVFLAACASPPYEVSELDMAAKLAGRPLPMIRCRKIDLEVPADTEIVVEGRILPNVRRPEGPFGEFMGYYVPVGDNHVFEILDVHWRPDPIYHALVCGSPEDLRPLEAVTAARIYKHVSALVPGIIDVSCRPNVMITIIKMKQQYEGHARHALLAAVGSHLDYNKVCIAVDEDIDIYNLEEVMWAYLTRGRADTRATIIPDVPGFYRDPHKDHWGRLLIDATTPWGREAEFQRKRIPGEDTINLADYLRKA